MGKTWALSFFRTCLAVASYALGAGALFAPTRAFWLHVSLGTIVGILTLTIEYFAEIRPARHWEDVRPIILSEVTDALFEFMENDVQIVPRMNIMVPKRTWRWIWTCRYFVIRWCRGMEYQPDVNIKFPIKYGVVGECFKRKESVLAPPDALSEDYSFPLTLRAYTKDIQAIISYPIYCPPERGRQSGKLIGVLTLDSKTSGAYVHLTKDEVFPVLHEKMERLARFVGHVYR